MNEMGWILTREEGVRLRLKVHPGARAQRFTEPREGRLGLSVTAPPEDGKANAAVIQVLAKTLKCAKGRIHITSGASSRLKDVEIEGVDAESVQATLMQKLR